MKKPYAISVEESELEYWKKEAERLKLGSVSNYIRFSLKKNANIKKYVELETKREYEDRIKELEDKIREYRTIVLKLANTPEIQENKEWDALPEHLKQHFRDMGVQAEKSMIEDHIMDMEWKSLSSKQKEKVWNLINVGGNSMPIAIKRVKGDCSKDFEKFFKDDLDAIQKKN